MATIIKIKNSATPGSTPASLAQGEMALNVTDGKLFYGSGSGNEVKEFTGASIDTGSLVTTSSFNSFTSSYNTGSFTGSFVGDGSGLTGIDTSSLVTTSSFNSFTSSYNTGSFTGSFTGDGSGLTGISIDTGSLVTTSSFNSFTSSYNTGSFSGSFIGTFQQITGITITSQSWGLTGSIYSSSISDANITSNTIVEVIPNNADYSIVVAAQLLPQNISSNGEVTVFAVNEPTDDIGVTLNLFK